MGEKSFWTTVIADGTNGDSEQMNDQIDADSNKCEDIEFQITTISTKDALLFTFAILALLLYYAPMILWALSYIDNTTTIYFVRKAYETIINQNTRSDISMAWANIAYEIPLLAWIKTILSLPLLLLMLPSPGAYVISICRYVLSNIHPSGWSIRLGAYRLSVSELIETSTALIIAKSALVVLIIFASSLYNTNPPFNVIDKYHNALPCGINISSLPTSPEDIKYYRDLSVRSEFTTLINNGRLQWVEISPAPYKQLVNKDILELNPEFLQLRYYRASNPDFDLLGLSNKQAFVECEQVITIAACSNNEFVRSAVRLLSRQKWTYSDLMINSPALDSSMAILIDGLDLLNQIPVLSSDTTKAIVNQSGAHLSYQYNTKRWRLFTAIYVALCLCVGFFFLFRYSPIKRVNTKMNAYHKP